MNKLFESFLDEIISREGGYVNHPNDKGGPTKYGITEAVARANGYTGSMRVMSENYARAIYYNKYIVEPGFDRVAEISPEIAFELTDTYVNMGRGNAETKDGPVYWLQRWLNALNAGGQHYKDIDVDGVIGRTGTETLGALSAFKRKRGSEGLVKLAHALNGQQAARYLRIIEANPRQESFAYGWLGRVSMGVQHDARKPLAMLSAPDVVETIGEAVDVYRNAKDTVESIGQAVEAAEDVFEPEPVKPTIVERAKAKATETSTIGGLVIIVATVLSNPDVIRALERAYYALNDGEGLASVVAILVGAAMVAYKQHPKT